MDLKPIQYLRFWNMQTYCSICSHPVLLQIEIQLHYIGHWHWNRFFKVNNSVYLYIILQYRYCHYVNKPNNGKIKSHSERLTSIEKGIHSPCGSNKIQTHNLFLLVAQYNKPASFELEETLPWYCSGDVQVERWAAPLNFHNIFVLVKLTKLLAL